MRRSGTESGQLYDTIGIGYRRYREPDPRIAAAVGRALGDAASVLNVGAGAGSYEPFDRRVVAVEPSFEMIRQRSAGEAPVVRALASALPFRTASFDAVLAVLTVHHWPDREGGVAELKRVASRRVVVLTHENAPERFWLEDYFQPIFRGSRWPSTSDAVKRALGRVREIVVPVPRDCRDGFLGAYWARPEAYLDPDVRAAISGFLKLDATELAEGVARLRADLRSGEWERRYGALLTRAELDLGYRLVVAEVA